MSALKNGITLLAEPFMADSNFKRSAIALVDHHEEGSVGFVLNHPLDWKITDMVNGFPSFDEMMSFGGPVQRDTLHFLHTLGSDIPESIHVKDNIYWGGDFERLTTLIQNGIATPENTRFFLGYSGWSPGQLEEEMNSNTWVVAELNEELIFKTEPKSAWSLAMNRLGNTYGVISQMDEESLN